MKVYRLMSFEELEKYANGEELVATNIPGDITSANEPVFYFARNLKELARFSLENDVICEFDVDEKLLKKGFGKVRVELSSGEYVVEILVPEYQVSSYSDKTIALTGCRQCSSNIGMVKATSDNKKIPANLKSYIQKFESHNLPEFLQKDDLGCAADIYEDGRKNGEIDDWAILCALRDSGIISDLECSLYGYGLDYAVDGFERVGIEKLKEKLREYYGDENLDWNLSLCLHYGGYTTEEEYEEAMYKCAQEDFYEDMNASEENELEYEEPSDKIKDLKEYLKLFAPCYGIAMKKIGEKVDVDSLKKLLDEMDYTYEYDSETSGTFNVNKANKQFKVVGNNFRKKGIEKINLLLLHECTHLTSKYHSDIFNRNPKELIEYLDKFNSIKSTQNTDFVLGGYDVRMGLLAIDEVIAQWYADRSNEAMKKISKSPKRKEEHGILGNKLIVTTDFSVDDFYAPLEERVEEMAINMGFKNIEEFAHCMYNGEKSIFDYVNEGTVKTIGCIGILCQGIYQEKGLQDCGLPDTDIKNAIEYLDSRRVGYDAPDTPELE